MARDYRLEYQARIAKGLERGLTRAAARGHVGPGQTSASGKLPTPKYDRQLESAVRQIRSGKSLKQASGTVGVSPERVRTYLASQGIGKKIGGRWHVGKDPRLRELPIFTDGEARTITVRGYERAAVVGDYMSAVGRFLETGDRSYLKPYVGKWVKDSEGHKVVFETDPNLLYQLSSGGSDAFAEIYRIEL